MTTEKHLFLSTGITARQADARPARTPSVCGCGQDLDICTGRHCPRCGTAFLRAA